MRSLKLSHTQTSVPCGTLNKKVAFRVEQNIRLSRKHVFTLHAANEKDAMTSRCLDRKRKYHAPPGECTLLTGPAGITYRMSFSDVWRDQSHRPVKQLSIG